MRREPLRISIAAWLLIGGASLALAQQPPAPEPPQQQQQQKENWQHTPSGKHGKEEPSSHAPSSKPQDNAALVNGALAVPGANPDAATVPAKFSERNAADDKLITVAHALKSLTDAQRKAIYQALKDRPAPSAFNADVGTALPAAIALEPVPNELVTQVPQIRDYRYAVAHDRVLLVSPPNRIVVGVFADAARGGTTGTGPGAR